MHQKFKNWCRLCAKSEGCTKDLLFEDDISPNIRLAVEKHFSLLVESDSEAPTTICDECHERLLKLVEFDDVVLHSQSIFKCNTIIEYIEEDTYEKVDISTPCEGTEDEEDVQQEATLRLDFLCTRCKEAFHSENELHDHMKSHSNAKLSCNICGTQFLRSFSLRNHRKLVHSDNRPFICEICGGGFKRSGDLTRHKDFHRDDTPFACKICGKKFKSKLVVQMHEKNHNNNKYACKVCGQELKTKHTLQGHMQTHTDDMQYQCIYCSKKFRFKKNLDCHLVTHTGLRPYVCVFCSQAFSLRWNCKTHQKRMHRAEMAQYEQEGKSVIITNVVKQKFACGRKKRCIQLES